MTAARTRIAVLVAGAFGVLFAGESRAITCPTGTFPIDEKLATGTRWEMCWEERAQEGIVLNDVNITLPGDTRRKVMKSASVAQIHVVYDDGSARRLIVTDDGLGANLVDLAAAQCPAGTLVSDGTISPLCKAQAGRGYVWKYFSNTSEGKQGYWLELFSISHTGALSWIVRWRFYDDGSIEPAVGSTGVLTRFGADPSYGQPVGSGGAVGIGWITSTYWRLDFDIGSNANDDVVERLEITNAYPIGYSDKVLGTTVLSSEVGESLDPQAKRSWRVRDNTTTNSDLHKVSYHLEPMQAGHHYVPMASEPWANYDLAVTAYRACERFPVGNPTTGGCAADLSGFINGENVNGADVVLWYRTTYHHLPRDEEGVNVPTRWQGFAVVPRDWTATNLLK